MRQFIGTCCTNFAACVIGLLAAVGLIVLMGGSVTKSGPAMRTPEPAGDWQLLAETPSGVRVWRIDHEKCLVPLCVVESANGSVAIR